MTNAHSTVSTIKNNRNVTKVNEASIEVEGEGTVPYGLLVWSTGLAPNPLIESITEFDKDPKTHGLKVDDSLRCLKDGEPVKDVYALGDASVLASGMLPATAQVASQQGAFLAKKLNAEARNVPFDKTFVFSNSGVLAYVGNFTALFDRSQVWPSRVMCTKGKRLNKQVQATTGPKVTEAGRLAFAIWRSAYWSQSRSIRNMVLTATYWCLNFVLGRDITRF